jgi:uncharacterized membrane protein YgcG
LVFSTKTLICTRRVISAPPYVTDDRELVVNELQAYMTTERQLFGDGGGGGGGSGRGGKKGGGGGGGGGGNEALAGAVYKLHPVDPYFESAWCNLFLTLS